MVWRGYFADPEAAAPYPGYEFDPEAGETFASINQHLTDKTLENELPKVDVPFLLIHGEKSPLPIDQVELTADITPNGRMARIANCGHMPWLERPNAVRDEIKSLLAELSE